VSEASNTAREPDEWEIATSSDTWLVCFSLVVYALVVIASVVIWFV